MVRPPVLRWLGPEYEPKVEVLVAEIDLLNHEIRFPDGKICRLRGKRKVMISVGGREFGHYVALYVDRLVGVVAEDFVLSRDGKVIIDLDIPVRFDHVEVWKLSEEDETAVESWILLSKEIRLIEKEVKKNGIGLHEWLGLGRLLADLYVERDAELAKVVLDTENWIWVLKLFAF